MKEEMGNGRGYSDLKVRSLFGDNIADSKNARILWTAFQRGEILFIYVLKDFLFIFISFSRILYHIIMWLPRIPMITGLIFSFIKNDPILCPVF